MRTPKANTKPTPPITFPPPSRHKLSAGDVLSFDGKVVVIHELPKGATKAKCYDQTGKACSVARDRLEEKFFKLGIKDAQFFQKQIGRLLKKSSKSTAAERTATKPAPKRAAKTTSSNAPASGPNPTLN